jgi:hypothetical protein
MERIDRFIPVPFQVVAHWAADKMKKRVYDFYEGAADDSPLLGLKGQFC